MVTAKLHEKINHILVEKKNSLSIEEIKSYINEIDNRQQIFPKIEQIALTIHLISTYDKKKQKAVVEIKEIKDKEKEIIILGVLAEDWSGMSNSIIDIIHHRGANIKFIKGLSLLRGSKKIGLVILSFSLDAQIDYQFFINHKERLLEELKDAVIDSGDKHNFFKDESIKFDIYNHIIKYIKSNFKGSPEELNKIAGANGEALKFICARSKEYLEERETKILCELIIDNYKFQQEILEGAKEELIKIKNFKTKFEKLTGITFASKEVLISVEDFLQILNYIVPNHMIKHHKSVVTPEGIFLYRIEIVDRYGKPLITEQINSIEKAIRKNIKSGISKTFNGLKSIGGFEHYARAIIPFLILELNNTKMTQVYIKLNRQNDFLIYGKIVAVSKQGKDKNRIPHLIRALESCEGIEVMSTIPTKKYTDGVEVDILKINITLSEFSSLQEIFLAIKSKLKEIYGEIRDFDQGFREIDMNVLSRLLKHFDFMESAFVRDIFFSFDELYRIQIPFDLMVEAIELCSLWSNKINENDKSKCIFLNKDVTEANKLILLMSCQEGEENKAIQSEFLQSIENNDFYITKVRWNRMVIIIAIISKDNEQVNIDNIKQIEKKYN